MHYQEIDYPTGQVSIDDYDLDTQTHHLLYIRTSQPDSTDWLYNKITGEWVENPPAEILPNSRLSDEIRHLGYKLQFLAHLPHILNTHETYQN